MAILVPYRVSFEDLKIFRQAKTAIKKAIGTEEPYYSVLHRFGLRHASEISSAEQQKAVADALAWEVNRAQWDAPPPKPKNAKKLIPFCWQEQFDDIRKHLLWLTESDDLFNQVLLKHGYGSVLEITGRKESIPVYKELAAKRNEIQLDRMTPEHEKHELKCMGERYGA